MPYFSQTNISINLINNNSPERNILFQSKYFNLFSTLIGSVTFLLSSVGWLDGRSICRSVCQFPVREITLSTLQLEQFLTFHPPSFFYSPYCQFSLTVRHFSNPLTVNTNICHSARSSTWRSVPRWQMHKKLDAQLVGLIDWWTDRLHLSVYLT